MKRITIFIFSWLLPLTILAQNDRTVELKWKIRSGEKLFYKTMMNEIDTESSQLNFDGFFKLFSNNANDIQKESKDFFKELNKAANDKDYISILTNAGNGVIDIVLRSKTKKNNKSKDADSAENPQVAKMMRLMNDRIALRGSVYENGSIHSFWVNNKQKNIIALFFELPAKPVKIGDTWKLDINFIANDEHFECESSHKSNEVSLIDIREVNGETVAVLKYTIEEYVKGDFTTPEIPEISEASVTKTMMRFTHYAIAEFSIDKGRWISYSGIMSMDATGILKAKKKTDFSLILQ